MERARLFTSEESRRSVLSYWEAAELKEYGLTLSFSDTYVEIVQAEEWSCVFSDGPTD